MAVTNQISPEEDQRLAEHLQVCPVCKQTFEHFSQIAAQLYGEAPTSTMAAEAFDASGENASERVRARERLLGKVRQTINLPLTEDRPTAIAEKRKMAWGLSRQRVPSWGTWALAAALFLAVCLDLTHSWLSHRHSRDEEARSASLKSEVDELRGELTRLQAIPVKPMLEAPSKTRDDDTQKLRADNEAMHQTLLHL